MTIEPDTKDWTWVLDRQCPECGFDAWSLDRAHLAAEVAANAARMSALLAASPDPGRRPHPGSWSLLEYGAHVRDVHLVFAERVRLMLEHDAPAFANWDQDEAARLGRYGDQAPSRVAAEIGSTGEDLAATLRAVREADWGRTGLRTNGSRFTIETIARYALHDLAHHWHDVTGERADRPAAGDDSNQALDALPPIGTAASDGA